MEDGEAHAPANLAAHLIPWHTFLVCSTVVTNDAISYSLLDVGFDE